MVNPKNTALNTMGFAHSNKFLYTNLKNLGPLICGVFPRLEFADCMLMVQINMVLCSLSSYKLEARIQRSYLQVQTLDQKIVRGAVSLDHVHAHFPLAFIYFLFWLHQVFTEVHRLGRCRVWAQLLLDMWNICLQTRDRILIPCFEKWILNRRTTREVLPLFLI